MNGQGASFDDRAEAAANAELVITGKGGRGMWTPTREAIDDPFDPGETAETSLVRSDDGALVVHQGANRESVQFFDYVLDEFRIPLAGSQYDADGLNPSERFTVYLSFRLASLRRRHPDRPDPTAAAIARLKADLVEALPALGGPLALEVPIKHVVFE